MKQKRWKWTKRGVITWSTGSLILLVAGFIVFGYSKKLGHPVECDYGVSDPAFAASMTHLLGPALEPGNKITTLINGDQIFPAMIQAIGKAEKSITLENYIWEPGKVGDMFTKALIEKAQKGVKVLVLVDGMGTLKLDKDDIKKLLDGGVEFVKFHRARWYHIKPNLNHRTHRKILVVDGKIGFTGGACIADKWLGNAENFEQWRDTHFQIEGPSVGQLQGIFAGNWAETTGKLIEGPDFFPALEKVGDVPVQCFRSGPNEGDENARLVFLYAIAASKKSIRIAHAYFVPDDLVLETLLKARQRGVDIEVIVPGKHDSAVGRAASRSRWDHLAKAGVKFYEYKKSLFHCKVMIVDDLWVSAGSINFDNRSFQINDEANFNVLNAKFAREQLDIFEKDKEFSTPLTLAQLQNRPWYKKAGDKMAGLLQSQL